MNEPFPTVDGALLDSLLNLMDCEFHLFYPREGQENKTPEEVDQCAEHMEAIFFFAFIWSDSVSSLNFNFGKMTRLTQVGLLHRRPGGPPLHGRVHEAAHAHEFI